MNLSNVRHAFSPQTPDYDRLNPRIARTAILAMMANTAMVVPLLFSCIAPLSVRNSSWSSYSAARLPFTLSEASPVVDGKGQEILRAAYVINNDDSTVSPYRVSSDGSLSLMSNPVETGENPLSIVVHPSGRYA